MTDPEGQREQMGGARRGARPARSHRIGLQIRAPRSSDTASYLQIEEELADQIETGALLPGSRIPPERDLAQQLGVSRMTLRQALARLEHRGLVARHQGRGTFVAEPKLRQRANVLRGFFAETVGQGVVPVSRTIQRSAVRATRALAGALGLRSDDEVYKIVRVRLVRSVPIVLETSFFPARILPGLIDLDLDHGSIYHLMERRYAARPVTGIQSMEPVAAEPEEAELLEVPPGSPLMLLERTAWDEAGRAVEHARDLYRGDRSRFVTELSL